MKALLLSLLLLLTMSACAPAQASDAMTLFVINVGKADAQLLRYGDMVYLIDTGSAESWGALSRALKLLEINHLDGVIITHTDKDHVGGVPMLAASSLTIDGWYASRYFTDVKESKHPVLLAAKGRGQAVVWLSQGDTLPLGDGSLSVLGPARPSDEENDNSVILLAEGAGGRMLLMGDAEFPAERALMKAYPRLPRCQVLKVGHHGGDGATSEELLSLVRPQVAVISTSTAVREDTPAASVLRRLHQAGAEVAVTQDGGAGVLVTLQDGKAAMALIDWVPLPPPADGIHLADKDNNDDIITILNESDETVDLSDWYLISERGGEIYIFPRGVTLAPGASLTLGTFSTDASHDLLWQEKNVWHNKKSDAALLFDAYGREIDTLH